MMPLRFATSILVLPLLFTSCANLPTAAQQSPNAAAAKGAGEEAKAKDDAKAEARKQKQKELRNKQRELATARIELEIAGIDTERKAAEVALATARAAEDFAEATRMLELFRSEQRSREIEEKKIAYDRASNRADEAKDELGELEAMYANDEFAKPTKELVLKRGRRQLELATRDLVVAQGELAEFERHTLPQRERELQRKLQDAEQEQAKAAAGAKKAGLEQQLADQKAQQRIADLEEDIAELTAALAKDPS